MTKGACRNTGTCYPMTRSEPIRTRPGHAGRPAGPGRNHARTGRPTRPGNFLKFACDLHGHAIRHRNARRHCRGSCPDTCGAQESRADTPERRFDFHATPWDGDNVTTAQELIAELPGDAEAIPTRVIRGIVNDHLGRWDRDAVSYAVKSGAIRPLPEPARGRRGYLVDRDEAVLILVAAVLAFAAGVAVVAMIRAIRISGVDPSVFVQAT